MSRSRQELEAYLDAAAPVAGLSFDPAQRARIVDALEMAAAAAGLVMDFALDEADDEPAPVFRPGTV